MRRLAVVAAALLMALPAASAEALVVNNGTIYWMRDSGGIGSVNVDGTGLKRQLVRGVTADDLAVDGAYLYWSGEDRRGKTVIGRAGTDGRHVKRKLLKADAHAIAAYGGSVYWLTGKTIGRARASGRGAKPRLLNVRQSGWQASDLAVGPAGIFWGQGLAGKAKERARESGPIARIGRADLSGAHADHDFASWRAHALFVSDPRVIGLDGPSLYWLTANPDNVLHHLAAEADDVGFCQPVLSNCEVLMRLADEAVNPNSRFAVADGVLYWATPVDGGTRLYAAPIERETIAGIPGASETLQASRQIAFVRDAIR